MSNDICLQCHQRPKKPDHTFCSTACNTAAANKSPGLIEIPKDHVMYLNAARAFHNGIQGNSPPIKKIYLVTWTKQSRDEFEAYRNKVEKRGNFVAAGKYPGNEQKRLRGAERACTIGENGNTTMCYSTSCKLCETLRCGFRPYLDLKRTTG
ncbi:hypothetical protein QQZ08_007409 [Neonectria magnoliae]|uniref:Uncharacterized protein n=1 Tax=Neonectria magnoliae TaxID=2732573 RepID=A0ABR1HY04_9HYPO